MPASTREIVGGSDSGRRASRRSSYTAPRTPSTPTPTRLRWRRRFLAPSCSPWSGLATRCPIVLSGTSSCQPYCGTRCGTLRLHSEQTTATDPGCHPELGRPFIHSTSQRDCPKSLGDARSAALQSAEKGPFRPPHYARIHLRSVAQTLFRQSQKVNSPKFG